VRLSRRGFIALGSASAAAAVHAAYSQGRGDGHLRAHFKTPTKKIEPGSHELLLGGQRDGLLIVPAKYQADRPAPMFVALHGAGGSARRVSAIFFAAAEETGTILLIPESRDRTWDAIRDRFGPDVDFLDRALNHAFDRCAVDRKRVAIGGFSDGATYGLSIGIASGDLFTCILACSPGFIVPTTTRGKPRIFMSHGTKDQILPIESTSRRILPDLQRAGYVVRYREFDGPHTVPPAISQEALKFISE
jgi:phospholipase/carboxylesterase